MNSKRLIGRFVRGVGVLAVIVGCGGLLRAGRVEPDFTPPGDATADDPGISIARLSIAIKSLSLMVSDREFEQALENTRAQQDSKERMAAVLAGELSLYRAQRLSGQERIDFLEQAARNGDAAAAAALGDMLDTGDGLAADAGRAFAYSRAGALGGRMDAAHNAGAAYATGRGVRRDFTEALAWLIVARERGDKSGAEAQLRRHLLDRQRLAVVAAAETRAGELRPKLAGAAIVAALPPAAPLTFVAVEAKVPTLDASDLDNRKSDAVPVAPELVVMTIMGERMAWPTLADLQSAARREEPAALGALGRLLVAGKVLPADPLRAVVLLERGAALGDVDAAQQLGDLYSDGEKILRDDAKAFSFFKQAALGGSALAMANVGVYFTNGRGTERNLVNGLAWLMAAKHYRVDLGQESRLRTFLAQHNPGDVAKAEEIAVGLIHEIAARGQ